MSQQTEKCGCRIKAVDGLALESPTIEYCRTHAAALDMLEALGGIAKLCEGHIGLPLIFSIDEISHAAITEATPK